MNAMKDAGLQVTMNESEMTVSVTVMTDEGPITPTTPTVPSSSDYLPLAAGAVVLALAAVAVIVILKRRQ